MSWNSIIGQQRVKQLLRRILETNRLPHALLFYGPDGVGKEAVALELAKVLNCERGGWDACGECPTCMQMATLRHPRLKLIFGMPSKPEEKSAIDKFSETELAEFHALLDAKASNPYTKMIMGKAAGIKVSSIRDLRHDAIFRTDGIGRTVVIVCDADTMNPNAANALLKTLEEPTGDLLLILCTSSRERLLPTIVSRCQQIRFEPLRDEDIRAGLEALDEFDGKHIAAGVQYAAGSFREAVRAARDSGIIPRTEVLLFLREVVSYNPSRLIPKIQEYAARDDRRAVELFLRAVAEWFRDVDAVQAGETARLRNAELRDPIEKFAGHYTQVHCADAVFAIENTIELLGRNVHLTTALIVLAQNLRRSIVPNDPK